MKTLALTLSLLIGFAASASTKSKDCPYKFGKNIGNYLTSPGHRSANPATVASNVQSPAKTRIIK